MAEILNLRHTFGSTKRKGEWHVPATVRLRQRMGSTDLDFTEAVFADAHTVLDVDMLGGSIELRVADGLHVESQLETTWASYQDHRSSNPDRAAASLTLRGRAIWGSVEVRGPKRRPGKRS